MRPTTAISAANLWIDGLCAMPRTRGRVSGSRRRRMRGQHRDKENAHWVFLGSGLV